MTSVTRYVFRSTWTIGAPSDDVWSILRDLETYPLWWRQIKEVAPAGDDSYKIRVRSSLPYDLRFTSSLLREDRREGLLEARLDGDLEGISRWSILETVNGCDVRFFEDVDTRKRSLNLLAPVARPAFKLNHGVMMKAGENGLRIFVAGRRSSRGE